MAIQYIKECTRCAVKLGSRNQIGLCRGCAQVVNYERSLTATCEWCPTAISSDRKMGLCTPCYNKAYALDRPGFGARAQARWREKHKERSAEESRRYLRSVHGRYVASKGVARRRGLEWSLDEVAYTSLVTAPCSYCGGKLNETGSGLDRIDNSKGYIQGNVTSCCMECNRIKCHLLAHEEMLVAMAAVIKLRNRKKLTLVPAEKS